MVNCPASYQSEIVVTQTVDVYTTVCPASATVTVPTTTSTPTPAGELPTVIVDLITDIIVLVPCETPVVETFVPPSGTPAVVVVPTGGVSVPVKAVTTAAPLAIHGPVRREGKGYSNGTSTSTTKGLTEPESPACRSYRRPLGRL